MLFSWSEKIVARLDKLASAFAYDSNYAVFDADGTLWSNDLSVSLLSLLESEKIISVGRYNEAMFPMPIMSGESLVSYYLRLCDADINLGYFWLCQAFSGFSPGELKEHIDDLFNKNGSISYMAFQNDGSLVEKRIDRPTVFFWQQELRAFLFEKEIKVYVVTASQEELVRMVVADPKYGFDIPSSSVIGMRLALRSSNGKNLLGQYDKSLNKNYYESMITSSLSGITTWYSGKVAAIKEYVDPVKKPVLVAGNSESDLAMLDYAKTDPGMKLLVTENHEQQRLLKEKICAMKGLDDKKERQLLKTKSWEFVSPDQF
jgi:hypothetical protein